MDDLRRRFAALDAIAVPDLWAEIERRTAGVPVAQVVRRVRPSAGRMPTFRPSFALLALGLVAVLLSGGLAVGSWLLDSRNKVLDPSEPPTPNSPSPAPTSPGGLRCSEVQATAARSATGWDVGSSRDAMSQPEPGWIAAVTEGGRVVLIDPFNGETCLLIEPGGYEVSRLAGWSANGGALAIHRADAEAADDAFIVWSSRGMYRSPLPGSHVWSPDGKYLVSARVSGRHEGNVTVSIVPSDGGAPRQILSCDGFCGIDGGSLRWSPSGARASLVHSRRDPVTDEIARTFAILSMPDGETIAELDRRLFETIPDAAFVRWRDEDTLLFADAVRDRFYAVPFERPMEFADLGPIGEETLFADDSPYIGMRSQLISPDGALEAFLRQHITEAGEMINQLVVNERFGPRARQWVVAEDWDLDGGQLVWSPDSRSLAFTRSPAGEAGMWIFDWRADRLRQLSLERLSIGPNSWQTVWTEP